MYDADVKVVELLRWNCGGRRDLEGIIRHIALRNAPVVHDDLRWQYRHLDPIDGLIFRFDHQALDAVALCRADDDRYLRRSCAGVLDRHRNDVRIVQRLARKRAVHAKVG